MAEAILSALASKILQGLGSLLIQEIGAATGVKKELRKLEESLSTVDAVLLDAEMKVAMNHEVKDWLRKLKDVAYDIEDVLDEFATEALRQKVELPNNMIVKQVRRCFSRSNPLVFRLQMANRIKDIIERLDRIQKDDVRAKSQFTTQSVDMEINNDFRRHTNSVVIGSEVLGREKDKENLVELLTSGGNQENVMVIPIVGIGGLGKTTLAQYVYNDERVKTHFDLQMWVCVSFNFNVANIAKKILENQSESELKEKLSKKRYLLVLDDVWNEHPGKWEDLRKLLIGEASGSMILVTTRSQEVASIMRPIKSFYPLEGLNETDCESLFNERAFGKGKETNYPELVEIGKAIVKKCGGVPLAAKALGSLLCLKRYKKDWLDVLHTEIWNLGEQEREILPALRISYNHLPSHLKQCFAYCSLFPQDHEIDVGDLIHQWTAQGFIQPPLRGSHVTLEDIGNRYFRELLWRSFFQEVREDRFGNIKECKMHDLVHSLARWVAGIEWSEVDSGNRPISIPEGVRHMVVRGKEGDVLNHQTLITIDRAQKLRTLYLQGDEFNELGISSGFVSSLRGLRVLKLRDLGMRHVPSSIGYLEQLRYLDLSGNDFEALPNSICRLYNLQTLRLEYCTSFDEWPRDMTKLVCLRHLELKSKFAMKYMPCGLGQLASLQTLGYFIVGDSNDRRKRSLKKVMGGLGELHGLNQLQGFLCIDGLGNVRDARDAEEAKLKDKSELQSLKLCWLTECSRLPLEDEQVFENLQPHPNLKELKICNYEGIKMPRWMTLSSSLLPNIVELQIFDCSNLKCLPLIGEFPCLRHLSLFSLNSLESICNRLVVRGNKGAVEGGKPLMVLFPSLEELFLESLSSLESWTISIEEGEEIELFEGIKMPRWMIFSSSLLPNLVELHIGNCSNLKCLPLIGEFHCLRHLHLESLFALESICNKFVVRGNKGGEGKHLMVPFPLLEQLILKSLSNLESWTILEEESEIKVYERVKMPCWMILSSSLLPNLVELHIEYCSNLKCLPLIGEFPSLRCLQLFDLVALESICNKMVVRGNEGRREGKPLVVLFPLLEVLSFKRLRNLERWTISVEEEDDSVEADKETQDNHLHWLSLMFPRLTALSLRSCPILTTVPMLSVGGIQHLTSLRKLSIDGLDRLVSLPDCPAPSTLEELHIDGCPNLVIFPDCFFANLKLLSEFKIRNCSKDLTSLPEGIQHLTALKRLSIFRCPGLTTLPKGLENLSSLQVLDIQYCCNLSSLPEGIQHLTALETLRVRNCPDLKVLPNWLGNLALRVLEIS